MPILQYHCKTCQLDFEIWRRDPENIGEVECAVCEGHDVYALAAPTPTTRMGFVQIMGTVRAKDGEEAARKIRSGDTLETEEGEEPDEGGESVN